MPTIKFTKMHGAGNDYVYLDCFKYKIPDRPDSLAVQISDRHKGIGGDGLILIRRSERADARMQMFNADGSEAEMCGNGIRCVAKYLFDHGLVPRNRMTVETKAGILTLDIFSNFGIADKVRVDMGRPILDAQMIPTTFLNSPVVNQPVEIAGKRILVTCLSMGNPHCVVFVDELTDEWVLELGPKLERSEFFPARVNVEFVQIISKTEVRQRTWERGSGETLACGTGASAVCVAGVMTGKTDRKILNHLLGGDLELEWDQATDHVFKTGPATEVFHGEWQGNW